MIVFGEDQFGKVDTCDNGVHIATTFFHICYVPIIPIRSHIMSPRGEERPLELNMKSVLVAWGRTLLVGAALARGFMLREAKSGAPFIVALALFFFPIVLFISSYTAFRASPERQKELTGR